MEKEYITLIEKTVEKIKNTPQDIIEKTRLIQALKALCEALEHII